MLKRKIRELFIRYSGYWIYKEKHMAVGSDIVYELKNKINLPVNTIFDVGAHIGQTSLYFHKGIPNINIYAFEPIKSTYNVLLKNIQDFKNIKPHNIALGGIIENVEVKLFDKGGSSLNSLKHENMHLQGTKTETVKVITGDSFCKANNIDEVDLLKIDTEGYELEVLEGFREMIDNLRINAIFCEVGFSSYNNRNTFFCDLIKFADKNNFVFYGLYEQDNYNISINRNFANALFLNKNVIKSLNIKYKEGLINKL